MLHRMRKGALAVASVGLLGGIAQGTVIFSDTFENGPLGQVSAKDDDSPWDANDLKWYSALSQGSASLQDDTFAGAGSQKALQLASPDTFRRFGATFTSTTLGSTVGDKLVLSFDMRLAEAPSSNQWGFRFGLFNSAGTNITADNPNGTSQPPQQNDDYGYYVRFATGAPATVWNEIVDEPAGDNPCGGTTSGTAIGTAASPVAINDQVKHSFVFEIERLSASSVKLWLYYDGVLKATATDSASPYTTFDVIHIAQGNVSTDVRVDNVKLENTPIPEPAALGPLGVLGGLMIRQRRVARSRR